MHGSEFLILQYNFCPHNLGKIGLVPVYKMEGQLRLLTLIQIISVLSFQFNE